MPSQYYNQGFLEVNNKVIDYLLHDLHVMLLSSTYVFDPNHTSLTPLAAHEISVAGYTPGFGQSGRKALTSKTIEADLSLNRTLFKAASVTWTALGNGAQIGGCAIIRQITSDALSRPVAFLTSGTTRFTDGSDLPIVWPTDGWMRFRPGTS